MKKNLKIYLASPRGFCAGVKRAIDIVEKSLQKYNNTLQGYKTKIEKLKEELTQAKIRLSCWWCRKCCSRILFKK